MKKKFREVYKKGFTIKNYCNWIILSNDIKPLKISLNDRRFNVVGNGLRLAPDSSGDWTKTLFGTKENNIKFFFQGYHKHIKTEINNLIGYLKGLKVNRVDLQQTLNTKHKKDLEHINLTSEHLFMKELNNFGLECFVRDYLNDGNLTKTLTSIINKGGVNWIKSNRIYSLYLEFCSGDHLKPISKSPFFKRLRKTKEYDLLFGRSKVISFENKKFQVMELNNKLNVD